MYQVIVVDDEPLIARTVSRLISNVSSSFRVAEVCYDGETALKKIEEIKPDVVFSDIKMPKMSGLDLAEKIHQVYPQTKVVILSGYSEFEYAVSALKSGVFEYLIKPVNSQTISAVLEKLKMQLDAEYDTTRLTILKKMMHHSLPPISAEELAHYFPYEAYLVVLICCGSYLHSSVEFFNRNQELEKSCSFIQALSEQLRPNKMWTFGGYKANERVLVVGGTSETIASAEPVLSSVHAAQCSQGVPIMMVFGIYAQDDLSSIDSAILALSKFLKVNFLFGESACLKYGIKSPDFETSKEKYTLTTEEQQYIALLFKQKQYEKLKQYLKKFFMRHQAQPMHQIYLEELLKNILMSLVEYQQEILSFSECQNLIYRLVGNFCEYNALFDRFWEVVEKLFQLQRKMEYDHTAQNQLVQQVRSYIEEHYTQPLNLQSLAVEFGVVASYLGKLYQDYYHSSIKQDILTLRLQKAEILLKNFPTIPLKEIAKLTGFNDQFYFSKVFKKNYGQCPADFRKLYGEQD